MTDKSAVAAAKPVTKAFVTFLAGDGDYWKDVVSLARGLREAGSAYPLVVAVLPDVPEPHRRILISHGCIVREIAPVYPPENETLGQFGMAYYVTKYSKLHIWEFVEYERMVYLNPDIEVFDNIDELFDLPKGHFYAVMDRFREEMWSHTPQFQIVYSQQQYPEKVTWTAAEMGPPPARYFNAGVFVYEPSMPTANALLDTLRVWPTTAPLVELQEFLNMFFREQYKPISLVYSPLPATSWGHLKNVQPEKVKVVDYCAAAAGWPARIPVGVMADGQEPMPLQLVSWFGAGGMNLMTTPPTAAITPGPGMASYDYEELLRGRCYRCLGSDHFIAYCKNPLRCIHCLEPGHLRRECKNKHLPPKPLPPLLHRELSYPGPQTTQLILTQEMADEELRLRATALMISVATNDDMYPTKVKEAILGEFLETPLGAVNVSLIYPEPFLERFMEVRQWTRSL